MTWVKLTDGFAEDPRLHEAGPEAFTVHVAALCYCSRQLTDGEIPAKAAGILWPVEDPSAAIKALVANGLWKARGPDGWEIVDYLADQPSAETVRERQAQAKVRYESWKTRHGKPRSQRVVNGVDNASPSRPLEDGGRGRGAAPPRARAQPANRLPQLVLELPCNWHGVVFVGQCAICKNKFSRTRHFPCTCPSNESEHRYFSGQALASHLDRFPDCCATDTNLAGDE